MKSFLERRDQWGNGVSLWLIAGIVFLLPLITMSLSRLRLDNEVTGWLPAGDPQSRILDWYHSLFPSDDRVLVSWDDCSLTDPRLFEFNRRLEGVVINGRREGGSPYVRDVTLPTDLMQRMHREGVPFEEALQRVQGLLLGQGPLCVKLTEAARSHSITVGEEIRRVVAARLGVPVSLVKRSRPVAPEQEPPLEDEPAWKFHEALTAWAAEIEEPDLQLVWPRMHLNCEQSEAVRSLLSGLIINVADDEPCIERIWTVPGSMAAASVQFSDCGNVDQEIALQEIRLAAAAAGVPEGTLHVGGRPVTATAVNQAVLRAAWDNSQPVWNLAARSPMLLSVLVSTGLAWLMLGSLRLCLLVQTVSILCAAASLALVPPSGGTMNMVLIVMPTLLMVITVSGAIHLCNYWKNCGIADGNASIRSAVGMAWLPCLLACATTGIGMASLVSGSLVPVRDFGLYATIGCGLSFLCVVYVLPALMQYWPALPPQPQQLQHRFWNRMGQLLTRHYRLNIGVNLLLAAFCVVGMWWFRTETKVIRYFPDDSGVVRDYTFLEENLSGIVSVDTLVRFSRLQQEQIPFMDRARLVRDVQEALQAHPEISGTLSLASFLPWSPNPAEGATPANRRAAKIRRHQMGQRIHEKLREGGPDSAAVAALLSLPQESADWKRPGDALLNHAGDEVWRITCQASLMSDYDYQQLTAELNAIAAERLQACTIGRPQHVVTGLVPIFLRTQQALLDSLINSFGLAFVLIGGVMILLLRNMTAALWSMLPNVIPIAIVFGLLGWSGIRIDIGTMITASIALGIAVDGTLHLMTWFRNQLARKMSREEAVVQALEHCGPALWQTSAAVGAGMLMLFPVELLLISRFGWIMCAMVFAALWGDVILLPGLLAGPLGRAVERSLLLPSTSDDDPAASRPRVILDPEPEPVLLPAEPVVPERRVASAVARKPHFSRIGSVYPRHVTES